MDAASLQALASLSLCHHQEEGQAGCQSDQSYVRCWLAVGLITNWWLIVFKPTRRLQGQKKKKRLNVSKLKSKNVAEDFSRDLESKLSDAMYHDVLRHLFNRLWSPWTSYTPQPRLLRRKPERDTGTVYRKIAIYYGHARKTPAQHAVQEGCFCQCQTEVQKQLVRRISLDVVLLVHQQDRRNSGLRYTLDYNMNMRHFQK